MNVHDAPHRRLGDPCCGAARQPKSRSHARNSERGAAALRACRLAEEIAKYGTPDTPVTRTARANALLRVKVARAPPRAPTLASHSLNVRCKKTYRAAQRTNLL